MFEFITLVLFIWLSLATFRLTCKIAWGVAKLTAIILFGLAVPGLIGCFLLAGGFLFVFPLALVGIAFAIVRICL